MDPIKDTVETLLKNLKSRGFKESPEDILPSVFSEKERQHIAFGSLSKGYLRIAVDSSTWLYYFNLHKKKLTGLIRQRCADVKELVFYIGETGSREGNKGAAG